MRRVLNDSRLSEKILDCLVDGLRTLLDLPEPEALSNDDIPGHAHVERSTEIVHFNERDGSLTAAMPRPHSHRPQCTREPCKPTLLVASYEHEGEAQVLH